MAYETIRNGPPPENRPYNMKSNAEFKAWEKAWATYQGLDITPEPDLNVERTSKPGANLPVDPVRSALFAEAVAFIRDYTGNFGLILDLRADPRFGTKHFRLSDRQIEVVLASKRRDLEWAAKREQTPVVAKAPVADGWYKLDGNIFKVVKAVHGSGRPYAKILVVDAPQADATEPGYGNAHWDYAPGIVAQLDKSMALSLEEAKDLGRLYGVCIICAATLTDEESIAAGIGPICGGRLAKWMEETA